MGRCWFYYSTAGGEGLTPTLTLPLRGRGFLRIGVGDFCFVGVGDFDGLLGCLLGYGDWDGVGDVGG